MSLKLSPDMSTKKITRIVVGYNMCHDHEKYLALLDNIKRTFPTKKFQEITESINLKNKKHES